MRFFRHIEHLEICDESYYAPKKINTCIYREQHLGWGLCRSQMRNYDQFQAGIWDFSESKLPQSWHNSMNCAFVMPLVLYLCRQMCHDIYFPGFKLNTIFSILNFKSRLDSGRTLDFQMLAATALIRFVDVY